MPVQGDWDDMTCEQPPGYAGRPQRTQSRHRERAPAAGAKSFTHLWLAARAEGYGMGWVSLFDPQAVAAEVGMPPGADPIALLCLGPVAAFPGRPLLEETGWATPRPLDDLLAENRWPTPDP